MLSKTDDSVQEDILRPHQNELFQLAELAGIHMDPLVFSNLVQLLNMGVSPDAVYQLLKVIRRGGSNSRRHRSSRSSTASNDTVNTSDKA